MSMVAGDLPQGQGPHGDVPQGQVSEVQRLTKDAQSQAGSGPQQPPQQQGGPPGPMPQQGQQQGPVQPGPQQQGQQQQPMGPAGAGGQRIDMHKVFPPLMKAPQPWQARLQAAAQDPANHFHRILWRKVEQMHGKGGKSSGGRPQQ